MIKYILLILLILIILSIIYYFKSRHLESFENQNDYSFYTIEKNKDYELIHNKKNISNLNFNGKNYYLNTKKVKNEYSYRFLIDDTIIIHTSKNYFIKIMNNDQTIYFIKDNNNILIRNEEFENIGYIQKKKNIIVLNNNYLDYINDIFLSYIISLTN